MTESNGLVERLNGVGIGDLVLLLSNETESRASGFVKSLNRDTIRLSVEDPNHSPRNCRTGKLQYGAEQEYQLSHFDRYKILQRAGE
jgi:hypothetical protein